MPCYHPRRARLDENGHVDWTRRTAPWDRSHRTVNIPCGTCFGCMRNEQRDWALRCFHEATLYEELWTDDSTGVSTPLPKSCVVTLTYDQDHLPGDGALHHEDFQDFIRALRQYNRREHEKHGRAGPCPKLRYFMAGEYGGKTHRPHFHAILFNTTFEDTYGLAAGKAHESLNGSYSLDRIWGRGMATVDEFSFQGAMYVAGYVAKKMADRHPGPMVDQVDPETGETTPKPIRPEYRKMSTGGKDARGNQTFGLGHDWIMPRILEVFDRDYVTVGKWTYRPPRYYEKLLERSYPDAFARLKKRREGPMMESAEEWTEERCTVGEKVALSALQQRRDSL